MVVFLLGLTDQPWMLVLDRDRIRVTDLSNPIGILHSSSLVSSVLLYLLSV